MPSKHPFIGKMRVYLSSMYTFFNLNFNYLIKKASRTPDLDFSFFTHLRQWIEKSVPRDHRLSSLGKPRDANR